MAVTQTFALILCVDLALTETIAVIVYAPLEFPEAQQPSKQRAVLREASNRTGEGPEFSALKL